jgi:hypothetical protein
MHDRDLLDVLDSWVASLADEEFTAVLPLLRRTFGEYGAAERAGIGRAVRGHHGANGGTPDAHDEIDAERAAGALRTVAKILEGAA